MVATLPVVCLGETTVDVIATADRLSDDDTATFLGSWSEHIGGRGANFAAHASVQGATTRLISSVGTDFEQAGHLATLSARGVDVAGVRVDPALPTARTLCASDGDRTRMYFHPGAAEAGPSYRAHVARALGEAPAARLAFCTAGDAETNRAFLADVRAEVRLYAPAHEVATHPGDLLEACLERADILLLNEHEAGVLERRLDRPWESIVAGLGLRLAVVTRGARGCSLFEGAGRQDLAATSGGAAVDPTGAGDSFAAGFAVGWLSSGDPHASCRVGSATASLVVERRGSQTRVPTPEEVAARLSP